MLRNFLLSCCSVSFALAFSLNPVLARSARGGATEWTQLLNRAQLLKQTSQGDKSLANEVKQITNQATQIQNQLAQYRTMLQNLEKLPDHVWGQAQKDLNQLRTITQKGEGISFSMGNLNDVLTQRFPSFERFAAGIQNGTDYSLEYSKWSRTNRDTITGTLAQAGLTAKHFDTEQGTMVQLQQKSATAAGQMQALQVGHAIAGQQVDQMQKLRGLVAQHSTMIGTWYESEQAAKDLAQQRRVKFFKSASPATSGGQQMQPRW